MSRANNRVEPTAEKFIFEESMTSEEKGTLRNLIGLEDATVLNTTSDGKTNPTLILKTDANGAVTVADVTTDTLSFTTTNGEPQNLGELAWFQDEETLSLRLKGNTLLELGEETLYHVENNTGTTIEKGAAVMYAGTVGGSGKLRVKPWDGTDPKAFMGIATMAITGAEGTGYVTHFGKLKGIQTNGANYGQTWASGNIIYAVTGSGNLTNVAPSVGGYVVVAVIISASANNGTMFVRPTQVPSPAELGAAAAVHTHVSDDITDATSSSTPNTVVKRGASGEASFSSAVFTSTTRPTSNGTGTPDATSLITRNDGDLRYGFTYSDVEDALVDAASETPVKVVSVVLPIGTYQLDACVSSLCAAESGSVIGIKSSSNIRMSLTDYYGRNDVAPIGTSVINDGTTSSTRSLTGFTTFRRHLTGIIQVVSNSTEVYLDVAQAVAGGTPTTSRKRAYIITKAIS
jgi:hypothetical protein